VLQASLGTFEQAVWCKVLRDRGWTGARIGAALGRSEGYVNNLVRIVEHVSVVVLERWRDEQAGRTAVIVCATDWLAGVCRLEAARQDELLAERIARWEQRTIAG